MHWLKYYSDHGLAPPRITSAPRMPEAGILNRLDSLNPGLQDHKRLLSSSSSWLWWGWDVVHTMRPPTLPGSDRPPEPATACPRRPCRPVASSSECGGNRPPWAANNMTSHVRKFCAGRHRLDGQPVTPNLTSKKPRVEGHCNVVQRPACR